VPFQETLPCNKSRVRWESALDKRLYRITFHQNYFNRKARAMTFNLPDLPAYSGPLVSLIAGLLVLIMPRLLNYVVAFYLIITGILGLLHR